MTDFLSADHSDTNDWDSISLADTEVLEENPDAREASDFLSEGEHEGDSGDTATVSPSESIKLKYMGEEKCFSMEDTITLD